MRTWWLTALALGLALALAPACGDDARPPVRSGTRLELFRHVYEDGTQQIAGGWYDAEREESCTAAAWSGDELRCTPAHDAFPRAAWYPTADCSGPAVYLGDARYASVGTRPAIERLHRTTSVSLPEFSTSIRGGCAGPYNGADVRFYELAAEVPRAELVALVETVERAGSERIGLRVVESADGMRLPRSFVDADLDVDCAPRLDSDGRLRCAPPAAPALYLDPACTAPVLGGAPATPPPPFVSFGDGCTFAVHALGADAGVASDLFQLSGGTCVVASVALGQVFRLEPRPALALVELDRSAGPASATRLQPFTVSVGTASGSGGSGAGGGAGSAAGLPSAELLDRDLGVDCRPIVTPGGGLRCLPSDLADVVSGFDDDQCQAITGVAVAAPAATGCPSAPPAFAGAPSWNYAYRVGAPRTAYQRVTGGACAPMSGTVYTLGEMVPGSTFVGATLETDP
jgi:hypothetical protein